MNAVTRKQAKLLGMKTYFSGQPCKHGHLAMRKTANGQCVECALRITREWRAKNVAHRNVYRDQWNLENPEKVASYKKSSWQRMTKEKRRVVVARKNMSSRAAKQKWAQENRDKTRIANKNYALRNPDKIRASVMNRIARKKAAPGFYKENDIIRIRAGQKDKCAICRKKLGLRFDVDHIVPLARGGSNWPRNLQILCAPCNQSKNARDPIIFMQSLGRLL